MQVTLTGKHIEITDAIRSYAEEKAVKIPRYYDSVSQVEIVIDGSEGGGRHAVEIIVSADNAPDFIAKEAGTDLYACIDLALHKLERQIVKRKQKERDNRHSGSNDVFEV